MSTKGDNKLLLVKNSVALYARMILSVVIGLYTSRVVLEELGVDDYGVYNIVGGVVGLLGFLNNSMSSATSRFLTFEMGTGDQHRIQRTFGGAFTIHLGLAIVIAVICETGGIWFVNNHLVLPSESIRAANWVFQMSIFTTVITIVQVPFNAAIIANEKMNVFAFVEILNSALKLAIVYILIVVPDNKLEVYSTLLLGVSIIIGLYYYIYCKRHFPECRIRIIQDKELLKPMFAYSGWDLFGNISVTAKQQGSSVIMNWFYGVVANASAGIANIVSGTISGFSQVIMTAFRPRIIKYYSADRIEESLDLMSLGLRMGTVFYLMLVTPIYICIEDFLDIWLKTPPEYSAGFCRIMILSGLFNMITVVFITGIHATGKIQKMTLTGFVCNLLSVAMGYIGYRLGAAVDWIYWSFCFFNLVITVSVMTILKLQVKQVNMATFIKDLLRLFISGVVIATCCYLVSSVFHNRLATICILSITSLVSSIVVTFLFLLDKGQRIKAKDLILAKLHIQ